MIRLEFSIEDSPAGAKTAVYRVWHQNQPLIGASSLGFRLSEGASLASEFEIVDSTLTSNDSVWKPVFGERSEIRDHYRQLEVQLRCQTEQQLGMVLTFRCYNEGVAFRYQIEGNAGKSIEITDELTQFAFLKNHDSWSTAEAQGVHQQLPLSKLSGEIERPLTIRTGAGLHVAVGEAALDNFARMKLKRSEDAEYSLVSNLSGEVRSRLPVKSPWRVVMIAKTVGELLENNDLIRNLNEPCALADTSWIKPGKVIREITLTTAGGMACVDFAVKHNFQYIEFDAGWYGHEYDDVSDATTVTVDPKRSLGPLDLHKVIQYAEEHGVGVILYVNRRELERKLDVLLPLFKSWGIKGIKFGFVRVGTQEWTNWLHESVRKAAEYKLMVDVHDAYRSTGYERTYPNLMTVEGIGGDETAPSNQAALTNLFTRMLAGAADHTFCYFDDRVDRISSHSCQLAKAVCFYGPWQFLYWYDSPLPAFADSHTDNVIHETPELEFWDQMPTVWDDTRVIDGRIGEYAIIARRSKDQWFVGAMNDATPRTLKLPLDFLAPNVEYMARIYSDDSNVDTPTHVAVESRIVDKGTEIVMPLNANGGRALWIAPKPLE